MYDPRKDLGESTLLEGAYTLMGDLIGRGMSRAVYEMPFDVTKVVKVENSWEHKQNSMEWLVWDSFKNVKSIAKWLCPCHMISYNGNYLVMSRARDLLASEIPKKLPRFMSDAKVENLGVYDGRVVIRDYGTITLSLSDTLETWKP